MRHSSESVRMVRAIRRLTKRHRYPLAAVGNPIQTDDPLWRRYVERHGQNYPHQYHNGGIWPFIGGFWVLLLARLGLMDEARRALAELAAANREQDWQFNEWFHGESGAAMGMPGQSWNAALYVLAYQSLRDQSRFIG
jgi:glycogen debranching enzyme